MFYEKSALEMVKKFRLDEELNIAYIAEGPVAHNLADVDFPIDRLIPNYSTTVQICILIAVYMGFKEIYLLGCDCTGLINIINSRLNDASEFSYAYEISPNEKERMRQAGTKRPVISEILWQADLLETYGILRQYVQNHGGELYNATESSIIENLPRVHLLDVLSERKA